MSHACQILLPCEKQMVEVAEEEGEAAAQACFGHAPAQADSWYRQQPDPVCGKPPQVPMHETGLASSEVPLEVLTHQQELLA